MSTIDPTSEQLHAHITQTPPPPISTPPGFYDCVFSSSVSIDAAELAALRKDAERYRKLRAPQHSACPIVTDPINSMLTYTPSGLDAALDALPDS